MSKPFLMNASYIGDGWLYTMNNDLVLTKRKVKVYKWDTLPNSYVLDKGLTQLRVDQEERVFTKRRMWTLKEDDEAVIQKCIEYETGQIKAAIKSIKLANRKIDAINAWITEPTITERTDRR